MAGVGIVGIWFALYMGIQKITNKWRYKMKIDFEKKVTGSHSWCYNDDEYDVTLNLGGIPDELKDLYIRRAVELLSDDMSEKEFENCLTHGIWESL